MSITKIVSEEWWGRRARVADQDPKELLYEACLPTARSARGDPLLNEIIGRRREKLTLDALDDLMTHLAGLRDERKAVVLVTEGWLLYEPNPKLSDLVSTEWVGCRRRSSNHRCGPRRIVERSHNPAAGNAKPMFLGLPHSTVPAIFDRLRKTQPRQRHVLSGLCSRTGGV
jgi:hypothetical protein